MASHLRSEYEKRVWPEEEERLAHNLQVSTSLELRARAVAVAALAASYHARVAGRGPRASDFGTPILISGNLPKLAGSTEVLKSIDAIESLDLTE